MPPKTPAALRAAVARLDPESISGFDGEWERAIADSRDHYDLTPLRGFVEHWWIWVAVARYPERLARFRECERMASRCDDRSGRRAFQAETARILNGSADEAEAEARG
jgi:hypothetical protein